MACGTALIEKIQTIIASGANKKFGIITAQFLWSDQFASMPNPELAAFAHTLTWWPAYFAIGATLLFTFTRWRYGKGLTALIEEGKTLNDKATGT